MKKILVVLLMLCLIITWQIVDPTIEVQGNSGPPANLDLTLLIDSHAYDLDILIYQETPLTESQIETAQQAVDNDETMEYRYYKGAFPQVLIDFQDADGYVSNTLYGDVDYFYGDYDESLGLGRYVMMLEVPRVFKIVLVDQEGQMMISDVITMQSYDFRLTWDVRGLSFEEAVQYGVGEVTGLNINPWLDVRYYVHMLIRLVVTLLIEGGIFYLFGFRKKGSYILLVGLNVITQFILTFILVQALFEGMSGYGTFFLFVISEFFVFVGEMFVVSVFVKEHRWWRRLGFAFVANMASLLIGLWITSLIAPLMLI